MSKLAIDGGTPVRVEPFPAWPVFGELEERLILEVVRSGKWGGTGVVRNGPYKEKLPQLIEQFTKLQDAAYGVAVANGTVALTIALQAAGVQPGDEVIIPPYTFIATAAAALAYGVIPVFADVEEDTLLIDPEQVEQQITPKTKAIIAVHIAGAPANMTRLAEIAAKHGLALIEDAAQAVGARWDNKGVGAIGDCGTFSFQSSKNLNAGEGGMIVTDNKELWANAWSISNVGRVPEGGWYEHVRLGQNYRMTEFQAAILLAQMTRLEEQMRLREKNAALLTELLGATDGIRVLRRDPRVTRHAWHLYIFCLAPELAERVDKHDFICKLNAEGIPAAPGYVPLHRNEAIIGAVRRWTGETRLWSCPVSERASEKQAVWLGQNVLLADERAMHDIARAVRKVVESCFA